MRHYYARYTTKDGELRAVIRYRSRRTRDNECSYVMQDGRGWLDACTEKQALRDVRELYGLRPHERFFGEFIWIGAYSPVIGSPCETVYLRTH